VRLGERRRVGPLLVRGEWGAGKSHFISYVRAVCRDLEVASSVVNLNARGHALNHPQRSYPLLAENVELGGLPRGLRRVLIAKLADEEGRRRLERFSKYPASGELEKAIRSLCRHCEGEDLPVVEHFAWTTVLGGDVAWANYAYKRAKALERIAALGRLFRALGAPGLVLLFDEAETIDQLSNVRSRKGAYSVLGTLSRMDRVWCIFAVTKRFDHALGWDVPGVLDDYGLSKDARWFLRKWDKGDLDVLDPPGVDRRAARVLAAKVEDLYERAHAFRLGDPAGLRARVDEWAADPGRNPRTLMRKVIHYLDCLRPLPSVSQAVQPATENAGRYWGTQVLPGEETLLTGSGSVGTRSGSEKPLASHAPPSARLATPRSGSEEESAPLPAYPPSARVSPNPMPENEEDLWRQLKEARRQKEELEAQLEGEKANQSRGFYMKVSEEGAASLYGLRRFPITFYMQEWVRILDMKDEIRAFLKEYEGELARKR